eukprot:11668142-Alexandrium_andersonii.AAC.1
MCIRDRLATSAHTPESGFMHSARDRHKAGKRPSTGACASVEPSSREHSNLRNLTIAARQSDERL